MEMDENGAEAEDYLWSLGVGEALPEWLKELRKKERAEGLNQVPRKTVQKGGTRPGLGPQASEAAAPAAAATATGAAAAPAAVPVAKPVIEEKRINPEDGKPYTLAELATKYKGVYSQDEVLDFFKNDCIPAPVEKAAPAAGPATTASVSAPKGDAPKAAERAALLALSIKDWLAGLDDSGFVTQYHDQITSNFDSLDQIVDIYVRGGELDKQFFEDVGIKKLGHKRLFEKWFREQFN